MPIERDLAAIQERFRTESAAAERRRRVLLTLSASARAAFDNAESLLKDADLLREHARWHRAVALYVLTIEEYSKAGILAICARDGRWDEELAKALRHHESKQAFLTAMQGFIEWAKPRNEMLSTMLVKPPGVFVPDQAETSRWIQDGKKTLRKRKLDQLKQRELYVSLSKEDGSVAATPSATEAEAAALSESVREYRDVAATIVQHVELLARRQ